MSWGFRTLALALALMAAGPAAAQDNQSDGEKFLAALRDGKSGEAADLADQPGTTVVNYRGYSGDAALHIVTRARNGTWLGYLLSKGADPNIADSKGETPLIIAARLGYSEGVSRLLMRKPQVDKTNKLGETALIVAVQARQPAIVRMLLEAGADPDKADHAAGYTARDYARRDNRSSELLRLIETVESKKTAIVGPQVR